MKRTPILTCVKYVVYNFHHYVLNLVFTLEAGHTFVHSFVESLYTIRKTCKLANHVHCILFY